MQEPGRVNASEEEFIQREIAQLRSEYAREHEVDHWNSDSGEWEVEEEAVVAGEHGQGRWVEETEEESGGSLPELGADQSDTEELEGAGQGTAGA